MIARIPYCPQRTRMERQTFERLVGTLPGHWTLSRSLTHDEDDRVIRLRWIDLANPWGTIPGFLTFLDQRIYRNVVQTFFRADPDLAAFRRQYGDHVERLWSHEQLLKHLGQCISSQELLDVLTFLETQGIVDCFEDGLWKRGSQTKRIHNFGPTLEWLVQELLLRFHAAAVHRCVCFENWTLNDLDVLAFLPDGRILFVECKSGHLLKKRSIAERFVQRARAFPADLALLLLDTESDVPLGTIQQHVYNLLLPHERTPQASIQRYKGSSLHYLGGHLYLANTAGGIATTLEGILQYDRLEEAQSA